MLIVEREGEGEAKRYGVVIRRSLLFKASKLRFCVVGRKCLRGPWQLEQELDA